MGTIKMEFTKTVQISGDKDKYTISPEIKKYALLDLGFEQTNRGNFEYLGRSLDQNIAEFIQQYHYILDEMVARQIFTK